MCAATQTLGVKYDGTMFLPTGGALKDCNDIVCFSAGSKVTTK